ncbi:hypothetical protein D9M71_675030 [compost metagenome]
MQVVFQHHIAVQEQALVLLLMAPAIDQDLYGLRAGEYRQPFEDSAGEEVGSIRLGDDVAAPTHCVLSP